MKVSWLVALPLTLVIVGCDLNPFNAGCKEIDSGYSLCRTDDQSTYLIMKSGEQPEGGGVLEGGVEQVGWHGRYIVAWRHATFRGDPDGWMTIDTKAQKISGPVNKVEAMALLANNPPKDAATVWVNL